MSFKEVFLKAVDEANSDGTIGNMKARVLRRMAERPRRLAEIEAECCGEALAAGYASSGGPGAFDWNALLAFLKELLPIILALFNT